MLSTLFSAIFLPFVLLPFVAVAGRALRERTGWLALVAPVASFALLLQLAVAHPTGERIVLEVAWIPSLGLNLTFVIDGLALFFGLVVSGIGVLVVFYSQHYLDDHYRHHGRFYSYLLLFMGAMLGTVFSGNLLLLFVFWELTGLASFLLIGFLHEQGESRDGARMALLVTGGTGLLMLAGIVILGEAAGTYELAALLDGTARAQSPVMANAAFVLIALGALGKSAQFPFHFWLPNAMAAPTPVSAYLHSATMVKLGVFLIARIFPVFRECELWMPLLITVCFGTMLLGAVLALLAHDLKAILAYSTVSQLGFLLGFYGMAPATGAHGDLLHVANHVFYKGCLFMAVGIIDHAAGTRDLRELGGLGRRLPLLYGVVAVAAASMAGLPGTLGFISKEYMLKEKFAFWDDAAFLNGYPLAMVVIASVVKVAFSLRIVWGVFGGPQRVADFHAPGLAVQLPPLLLAIACLGFGLFPGVLGSALAALQTPGLHAAEPVTFSIWHGVSREFSLSVLIVVAGLALYSLLAMRHWRDARVPRWLRFDAGFEGAVKWLPAGAGTLGRWLHFDRPFDYLPIVLGSALALVVAYGWVERAALLPGAIGEQAFNPLRTVVVVLIAVAVVLTIRLQRWTAQLIAVSVIGLLVTFYYVLYQAPDLAMTQILVETATLLLVLLLLSRFPRSAEISEAQRSFSRTRQAANVVLAGGLGVVMTLVTLMGMRYRHPDPAGTFYLENTQPLAHGANTVNTILVDFRGFDTLLEITVLVIACLGGVGLLMRYRRSAAEYAEGEMGPAGYGLGRESEGKEPPTP